MLGTTCAKCRLPGQQDIRRGMQGGSIWSELGLRSDSQEEPACGSPRTQEGTAGTLSRVTGGGF